MTFTFVFATVVFVATFIAIASDKVHKTTAALAGSALMLLVVLPGVSHSVNNMASEMLSPDIINHASALGESTTSISSLGSYARYVNFDVFFTLAGMMIIVNVLSGTGLFQYIAIKSAKFAKGDPVRTMIILVIATSVLSAFLDNVTTILLIAPITFLVAAELGVMPIPFLMAETMASNIGGSATLIGDPPNLIIGSAAGLDFSSFIVNLSPFIVVVMILYCVCLAYYYRKRMVVTVEKRARIMEMDERSAITNPLNLRRAGIVAGLTLVGFLAHGAIGIQPSVVAMSGAALALLVCKINVDHVLEKMEWSTLFFFVGLFILVEGADHAGLMGEVTKLLTYISHLNPLIIILSIMWFCGIAVAIMNNVSFTAVMVTVIGSFLHTTPLFSNNIELQRLLWWGMALSVCLGGNFTIMAAAANLISVGVAEQTGHKISFMQFFRYGAPVTFCSLVLSSLYITLRFYFL